MSKCEAPPAVVTSLGYPELTVTVETMGGHVVGHPPRDLHTHTHTHTKTSISEQCGVNRGAHNHTGEGEEGRRGSGDRSYISRWSYEGCWPLCPWAPLDPSCPQTDGPHCGSTENPPRCCCLTRADKSENTEGKGQGQKTDRKERRENASWR